MIAFDFEYVKATSPEDAVEQFRTHQASDRTVMYYAGGTEFISRARMNEIKADTIIDIKEIPACHVLEEKDGLTIGAANTLTEVAESNMFPLLTAVIRSIATKTARNKITIGGNLMSHLPYKEAILPFLLADSILVIATSTGLKHIPLHDIYKEGIELREEEFIVQMKTDPKVAQQPFFHEKHTQHSKVNYPVVTLAGLQVGEDYRFACSGVCSFPFRFRELEEKISKRKDIKNVTELLPAPLVKDMHASDTYRAFVLQTTLQKMFGQMKGEAI